MKTEQRESGRRRNMDEWGFGPRVMMRLKVCSRCGNVSASSRYFCKACGHRLPRQSLYQLYKAKHRYCSACDTVVADAARYCPQCGERISIEKK